MIKRLTIVFVFFVIVTGLFIIYKNNFSSGTYDWYDGIGISALATFFYWVLVSVLERKERS